MDELRVITELRPVAPLATEQDLSAARTRLTAEFVQPRRRRHRLAWVGGVGAVAAAAAVAFVLVPSTGPAAKQAPTPTPDVLNAAAILDQAAKQAQAEPALTPRPDQYVYIKSEADNQIHEEWLSVDGLQAGLIRGDGGEIALAGCHNGKEDEVVGDKAVPGHTQPCQPILAYDPNLPTDPNALISYLEKGRSVDLKTQSGVNEVAKDVAALFTQSYVAPSVQSALFNTIAKIPGLSIDHDTPSGTVGIRWSFSGSGEMLFSTDGGQYRYVGSKTVARPSGAVGIMEQLQVGIVDKVGELPE